VEKDEAIIRKMTRISKGNNMEEPIEASQGQRHGQTKEALEACPRTHPNPQDKESRNPSISRNLMLGSQVFML
jgi:hypothetical protein